MADINICIDQKLEKEASKVFNDVGWDMNSAVKLFLMQVVIFKGIPFPIITESGFTLKVEQEILHKRDALIREKMSGKVKIL